MFRSGRKREAEYLYEVGDMEICSRVDAEAPKQTIGPCPIPARVSGEIRVSNISLVQNARAYNR